jgi:two-component system LytT family response regulator
MIRAYLLDDEELAIRRLERMLRETGQVEIVGFSCDPLHALVDMRKLVVDVLFLDIQMPALTGFEFLAKLQGMADPLVVFTTAYNEYALRAFEVNSVDYLVKPIEQEKLARALNKVERMRAGPRVPMEQLVRQLTQAITPAAPQYPERLPSRTGERVELVDLARVTHIYAEDKLTFAATPARQYVIDLPIAELELKLDPRRFVRIHRSTIVNLSHVRELYSHFGGKMLLRLKDDAKTELTVSRERVKELKDRLGL